VDAIPDWKYSTGCKSFLSEAIGTALTGSRFGGKSDPATLDAPTEAVKKLFSCAFTDRRITSNAECMSNRVMRLQFIRKPLTARKVMAVLFTPHNGQVVRAEVWKLPAATTAIDDVKVTK
jgi:hypothetical protein